MNCKICGEERIVSFPFDLIILNDTQVILYIFIQKYLLFTSSYVHPNKFLFNKHCL